MRLHPRDFLAVLVAGALAMTGTPVLARGHGGGHGFSHGGFHGARSGRAHSGGVHFGGFSHSRARVGVFIGAPLYSYSYFPYHSAAYAPLYTAPLATEYIEREPESRSPNDYWYYCPGSKTYYPYVNQCSGGWQTVEPLQPPVS